MKIRNVQHFFAEWVALSLIVPRMAARTKPGLIVLGVLLLVLFGLLQPRLAPDLGISLLYLLPVMVIAWAGGRLWGLGAAVAAAGTRFLIDAYAEIPHSSDEVAYWNFGMSVVVFVLVAELLPRLRDALDSERERARTDSLTSLGNRRFFEAVARAELARTKRYHRPLALGYVDVDYFKEVNDRLGHEAGDQLLRLIAREIRRVMRRSDMVGRMGGDEFAVLLPETSADGAEVAFRKMHAHLTAAVEREGFPVSFSMGVITSEDGEVSLESLLREADQTMYQVKHGGRGSIRFRALREPAAASGVGSAPAH
jgi:diguanylate cyclase (GGDEF)-like protein